MPLAQFSYQPEAGGIEFALAELKRGLTWLHVADRTSNPEARRQAAAEAEKVYRFVAPLVFRMPASAEQKPAVYRQLELLRMRLIVAGYWRLWLPGSLGTKTYWDFPVAARLLVAQACGSLVIIGKLVRMGRILPRFPGA